MTEQATPQPDAILPATASEATTASAQTPVPTALFCQACGNGLVASAAICPKCGTAVQTTGSLTPKSKTTAVVLAVLFGGFAWLYTYQKDSAKFWISLAVNVLVGIPLWFFLLGWVVNLPIAIWALVDMARRSSAFYEKYPSVNG